MQAPDYADIPKRFTDAPTTGTLGGYKTSWRPAKFGTKTYYLPTGLSFDQSSSDLIIIATRYGIELPRIRSRINKQAIHSSIHESCRALIGFWIKHKIEGKTSTTSSRPALVDYGHRYHENCILRVKAHRGVDMLACQYIFKNSSGSHTLVTRIATVDLANAFMVKTVVAEALAKLTWWDSLSNHKKSKFNTGNDIKAGFPVDWDEWLPKSLPKVDIEQLRKDIKKVIADR